MPAIPENREALEDSLANLLDEKLKEGPDKRRALAGFAAAYWRDRLRSGYVPEDMVTMVTRTEKILRSLSAELEV